VDGLATWSWKAGEAGPPVSIPSFRRKSAPQLVGERARKHEKPRGSRQSRGYDAEWVELRDRYAKSVKGRCEECARRGYLELGAHVDHIIPVKDDPDLRLEWSNLQMLCWSHHMGWKAKIEAYARKIGAISMLIQWCKHPETRPAHFAITRRGPLADLFDAEQAEGLRAAGE
jgi:hypothetical protein